MEMSRTTNINVPFSRMLGNTPYTTTVAPAMSLQTSTPTRYSFSFNELYYILYLQQEVEIIKVEDITPQLPQSSPEKKTLSKTKDSLATCEQCRGQPQAECIEHGPLLFPRKTGKSSGLKDIKLSYAISSFPDEVQLCCSSIPASGYGVSAKQDIPIGTWIGPYEGKRIRPEDVTNEMDTSYMWEIFQDGKLVCYLDASDENTSSWMRFIRCARHRDEQNLYAFQYCGNIYYRAYRNISVGQELLVWYDDKYQQHMGLPLNIQDMAVVDPNGNNLLYDLSACNVSRYPQKSTPVTPVVKSTHVTITQHTPVHVSPQVSVDFSGQQCIPLRTLEQRPVNIVHRVASVSPCTTLAVTQSTLKVPQHSSSNALHLKPASYPHKYPIAPIKICPTKTVMQNSLAVTPRIHNSVTQPVTKPTLEGRPLPSPNTKYLSHEQHPPSKKIRLTHSVDTSHDHHVDADKVPQHYVSKYSQHQETVISQCENITPREYDVEETNGTDVQMDHTEDAEMCLWRCGQCQRSFTQRSLLQIHVCPRMPNRPYKCGHCADSFSRSSELRTHVVRHTNEKPFKCGYCSRSFAGSTTLNNHIRTHTGEKPFVCGKCKRMFSTASQLSRHQRIPAECV